MTGGQYERLLLRGVLYLVLLACVPWFFLSNAESGHYEAGICFVLAIGFLAVSSSGNREASDDLVLEAAPLDRRSPARAKAEARK